MELEVHQISPHRPCHNISVGTILILPSYPCLGLQSGLFPSGVLTIYFVCLLQMCCLSNSFMILAIDEVIWHQKGTGKISIYAEK